MSFLVLQPSNRGSMSWLPYFNCILVLYVFVCVLMCVPRGAIDWPVVCDCGIS